MIVIDRSTGARISPEPSREQCEDMLFSVFRAFADMHPEIIREAVEDYQNNNTLRH